MNETELQALVALLECSPMPAMVIRKDLVIVWHNAAFAENFQAQLGEIAGFLQYQSPDNVNAMFYLFESMTKKRSWKGPFLDVDGEQARHFDVCASPLGDDLFLLLVYEITQHQEKLEVALHSSRSDRLTGLPNRHSFNERITHAVKQAHRGRKDQALLMLDLDGFKLVNDNFGHDAGDAVLVEVAKRIQGSIRETDFCARLGGDEFACVITNLQSQKAFCLVADKLIVAIHQPIQYHHHTLLVNVSVGIAMVEDKKTTEETIKDADRALYRAKEEGRGCWRFPPLATAPIPLFSAPVIFDDEISG